MNGFLLRGESNFHRARYLFAVIRGYVIVVGILFAMVTLGIIDIWLVLALLMPVPCLALILVSDFFPSYILTLSRVVFMDECIQVLDHKNRCWRQIDYAAIKRIDVSEWNCISASKVERNVALGKHIIIYLVDNAMFPFDTEFRQPKESIECYYQKDEYFPFYYSPEALEMLYRHMANYYINLQEGR